MKDKEAKGMNKLTMNQQYAQEFKKPIRKNRQVDKPKYEGLGQVYQKESD